MSNWFATTVSVLAGGGLTMIAAWLADGRMSERDRERRREERKERLVTRRNDFQRQTLLDLQVASQNLLRNAGAALHQDTLSYRATGIWQKQQLPEDMSDEGLRLITETMLLGSRIRDEEVRDLAERLRSQTTKVEFSSSQAEAEGSMLAAADMQLKLIQRIGQLLREIDDID